MGDRDAGPPVGPAIGDEKRPERRRADRRNRRVDLRRRRREIMNYIGALAVEGKRFEWHTNDRLRRALETSTTWRPLRSATSRRASSTRAGQRWRR
jgi:hypothetical protein